MYVCSIPDYLKILKRMPQDIKKVGSKYLLSQVQCSSVDLLDTIVVYCFILAGLSGFHWLLLSSKHNWIMLRAPSILHGKKLKPNL